LIWILGDYAVGDPALNRFFSLHVIALPPNTQKPPQQWVKGRPPGQKTKPPLGAFFTSRKASHDTYVDK
jgi:hypothetical protein